MSIEKEIESYNRQHLNDLLTRERDIRFNVYVRFKSDSTQYCQFPVMYDGTIIKNYFIGAAYQTNPTEYNSESVGKAIAFACSVSSIDHIEVKEVPDYDQNSRINDLLNNFV